MSVTKRRARFVNPQHAREKKMYRATKQVHAAILNELDGYRTYGGGGIERVGYLKKGQWHLSAEEALDDLTPAAIAAAAEGLVRVIRLRKLHRFYDLPLPAGADVAIRSINRAMSVRGVLSFVIDPNLGTPGFRARFDVIGSTR